MKTEVVKEPFDRFETIDCVNDGVECWIARELCCSFGYHEHIKNENVLC